MMANKLNSGVFFHECFSEGGDPILYVCLYLGALESSKTHKDLLWLANRQNHIISQYVHVFARVLMIEPAVQCCNMAYVNFPGNSIKFRIK